MCRGISHRLAAKKVKECAETGETILTNQQRKSLIDKKCNEFGNVIQETVTASLLMIDFTSTSGGMATTGKLAGAVDKTWAALTQDQMK